MITTITDPAFATGPTPSALTLPQHISPTAAKAYLGCSLQFYFERVAGIRKKTPVALHLGKVVHAALQVFHLARWRGTDDSPDTIAAAFEKSFLDLERDEGPVNFEDDTDRDNTRLDGLRVVAAYLDSPEAMKEKPRAVEVLLKENILGLSVPLTGAMDLIEGNFTPVDFKSEGSTRALACSMSRPRGMDGSHHEQGRLTRQTHDFSEGAEIHTRGRVCYPQTIRGSSPPADVRRKQRVIALLETAVTGIAENRYHPQPGMQCSWCQFKNECMRWLPGMSVRDALAA